MLLTFLLHYLTLVPHIMANVFNIKKLIKKLVLAPYKMQLVTVYGKKDLLVMLVIQQRFSFATICMQIRSDNVFLITL